jgi:hypothetical protein
MRVKPLRNEGESKERFRLHNTQDDFGGNLYEYEFELRSLMISVGHVEVPFSPRPARVLAKDCILYYVDY